MIYGERIRLRAVERQDLPRFVEWLNVREVQQGLGIVFPLSQESEERWYQDQMNRSAEERPFAVDVREGDEWVHIGSCGLFGFDRRVHQAELGITIGHAAYRDKGLGTAVMRTLLRHGFETLNLHRIELRVFDSNPRAIHVYEKVGFKREARLRQHHYLDGRYVDDWVMGILREEWKAMH